MSVLRTMRLLMLSVFVHVAASAFGAVRSVPVPSRNSVAKALVERCERKWFRTNLDHFSRAGLWTVKVGVNGSTVHVSITQVRGFRAALMQSKGPNGEESFRLRYYVCDDKHRAATESEPPGPIFFYLGNESDVLLYLNATGLMWENAERFGAMLIFAEHRYYGESIPFGKDTYKHMSWLSSEQALADYATLIFDFKRHHRIEDSPVIGFGGSYGGMLATWARLKYPHIWQGAIAGSAPIFTFEAETPPADPLFYSKTVTFDTTPAAGAPKGCTTALRSAFGTLTKMIEADHPLGQPRNTEEAGATQERRLFESMSSATEALRICPNVKLNGTEDVAAVRDWAAAAFDMMAMGQYPYPSSYMLNGNGLLPAFPVRVACSKMLQSLQDSLHIEDARTATLLREAGTSAPASAHARANAGLARQLLSEADDVQHQTFARRPEAILRGLAEAVGVWYNYSGTENCFNPWQGVNKETALVGNLWDYQYCTEMFMPMAKSGTEDIYWSEPWNDTAARQACESAWGLQPRATWGTVQYGGHDLSTLSNVVFTNGLYDPWHLGGVLQDLSDTVKALIIPEGGHHLDLFFSNPDDPESVKRVRKEQMRNVDQWIREYHETREER